MPLRRSTRNRTPAKNGIHSAVPASVKISSAKKRKSKSNSKSKSITTTVPTPAKFGHFTLEFVDRPLLKEALSEYEYVSPPKTCCEKLCLIQLWNYTAELYPEWLAPNSVTFFGYCCSLIVLVMTLNLAPNFPDWYYLLTSFLMFLYQTADGSDGPQARRLKCGSALGELFDHGVDAVVTSIIYLVCAEMVGTGITSPLAPVLFSCTVSAFFFSNASLLHTGRQIFNNFDAQELQVLAQISLIVTYWFGKEMWQYKLSMPAFVTTMVNECVPVSFQAALDINVTESTLELRGFVHMVVMTGTLINCIHACSVVSKHYSNSEKVAITGRTISEFWQQVRSMLLLFALFGFSWYVCSTAVSMDESENHSNTKYAYRLWFISCAFAYADLVNHVLVLRVAKIPMPSMLRTRSFWLMSLFIIWTELGNRNVHSIIVDYNQMGRFIICIMCFSSHLYYSITVGDAIAEGLGVFFFKVPKEKQLAFLKSQK